MIIVHNGMIRNKFVVAGQLYKFLTLNLENVALSSVSHIQICKNTIFIKLYLFSFLGKKGDLCVCLCVCLCVFVFVCVCVCVCVCEREENPVS